MSTIQFKGFQITNENAASSYGIPVLIDSDGVACGPADFPRIECGAFKMLERTESAQQVAASLMLSTHASEEQREAARAFYEQRAL